MTSTFTGRRGGRWRSYTEVLSHQAKYTTWAAENAYGLWQFTSALVPAGGNVLEIGCGSRAGTLVLHHTAGTPAVGIDYDVPALNWRGVVSQLRANGAERAAKTAVRRMLFDRRYYGRLAELYGAPLRMDADTRQMGARSLAFSSQSFDLVYSSAVFEHIDGIESATAEIARVLKPMGTAWIGVHLYPSLSGGHALGWIDPSNPPPSPPPWDHLRQQTHPAHVYLNRLRADDYLEVFRRYFAGVNHRFVIEGEDLVTDQILAETGYSREDLTRTTLEVTLTRALANPVLRKEPIVEVHRA